MRVDDDHIHDPFDPDGTGALCHALLLVVFVIVVLIGFAT